jgi:hypothetical protein
MGRYGLMASHSDATRAPIPFLSLVFGYGPVAPFAAAAVGAWTMPAPWPGLATRLAVIWGGIILVFVAGVRRGYGFGDSGASTFREIATMIVYVVLGGLSLVFASFGLPMVALWVQLASFIVVPIFDRKAAFTGDAPPYFARLRPPQMTIVILALAALIARLASRA